jgi:hypothetical protein
MIRLLSHDRCVLIRDGDQAGVWTALRLPEGREHDDVVASLFQQVAAVAQALQVIAPLEPAGELPSEAG